MNFTLLVIVAMLLISLLAPFVAIYAVMLAKQKRYTKHRQIQTGLFTVCVAGVLVLEGYIRFSGGSGSLVANSAYVHAGFFKYLLIAHIIGAVLTYLIWGITIFLSRKKFSAKQQLPGSFSGVHKVLGALTIVGLFYVAVTALVVCTLAFFL